MRPMTKTMMTYSRDQVSGGCRGLVVIGRHAQANRDLKHDEANGRDDVDDGDNGDGDDDDDEEEDCDGNEDEAGDNDDWTCSNWKTRPTKPRPKNMMKLMVGKMLKTFTTPN